MKQGKSLEELAAELTRQNAQKRDFIADTRELHMTDGLQVLIGGSGAARAEAGQPGGYEATTHAHHQIAERAGIPTKYYDRMRAEAPQLLARNVNHWWDTNPERRMVRTLDGRARAFLSSKFRPLDNFDLMEAILPALLQGGCRVESCEVTEARLYLKVVSERITDQVSVGEIVQGGLSISNGETGCGALNIELLLWELRCKNGMIASRLARKAHLGRAQTDVSAVELWTDKTRQITDAAFWAQVRDTVRGSLQDESFRAVLDGVKRAAGQPFANPVKAVEVLAKVAGLTEAEGGGILKHLAEGGEMHRWGLARAVTRYAQDVESYDRATELERLGGQVIELPPTDWQRMAEAA